MGLQSVCLNRIAASSEPQNSMDNTENKFPTFKTYFRAINLAVLHYHCFQLPGTIAFGSR